MVGIPSAIVYGREHGVLHPFVHGERTRVEALARPNNGEADNGEDQRALARYDVLYVDTSECEEWRMYAARRGSPPWSERGVKVAIHASGRNGSISPESSWV
jgi:hypothetical protein